MKKTVAFLLALLTVVSLISCGECKEHVDDDLDNVCDKCDEIIDTELGPNEGGAILGPLVPINP